VERGTKGLTRERVDMTTLTRHWSRRLGVQIWSWNCMSHLCHRLSHRRHTQGVGLVIHSSTEADVFRTGTGLCVIMHTQPEVTWHTSVLRISNQIRWVKGRWTHPYLHEVTRDNAVGMEWGCDRHLSLVTRQVRARFVVLRCHFSASIYSVPSTLLGIST
jgi:hypothetical protein